MSKKKRKKLTFKDVYQLPFSLDEHSMSYIWSANGVMTFNYFFRNEDNINIILGILNGTLKDKVTNKLTYEEGCIKIEGKPMLLLRGWGHLTGCGALNLPPDQAANIQDDFANWVVNKLKGVEV